MKMKLYICGPVSLGGTCTPEQEQENTNKFHVAERQLIAAGYHVESPVRIEYFLDLADLGLDLPGSNAKLLSGLDRWQWYMRRTIIQMLTCHGVAILENAQESRGCRLEIGLAHDIGLIAKPLNQWLRLAAPKDPGLCAHLNIVNVREWRGLDMDSDLFIGDCADCKSTIKVEKP